MAPSGKYSYAREEHVRVPPDPVPSAPPRSLSPPGVSIEYSDEKGFAAKLRGPIIKRLAAWVLPGIFSFFGAGVLGYYEGLKRGAARVAAVEFEIDRAKAQLVQRKTDDDRLFVLEGDHDARLMRIERELKLVPLTVRPGAQTGAQ